MKTAIVALALVGFAAPALARDPRPGEIINTGRMFLYRDYVETQWTDWTAKELSRFNYGHDLHIRGDGKDADFDGILHVECGPNSGFQWKTAVNFGEQLDPKKVSIPDMVLANVKMRFCK